MSSRQNEAAKPRAEAAASQQDPKQEGQVVRENSSTSDVSPFATWINGLKVGDEVCVVTSFNLDVIKTVTKVTRTQIQVGPYQKYRKTNGRAVGNTNRWCVPSICKVTDAIRLTVKTNEAIDRLRRVNWLSLPNDVVIAIDDMIAKAREAK